VNGEKDRIESDQKTQPGGARRRLHQRDCSDHFALKEAKGRFITVKAKNFEASCCPVFRGMRWPERIACPYCAQKRVTTQTRLTPLGISHALILVTVQPEADQPWAETGADQRPTPHEKKTGGA